MVGFSEPNLNGLVFFKGVFSLKLCLEEELQVAGLHPQASLLSGRCCKKHGRFETSRSLLCALLKESGKRELCVRECGLFSPWDCSVSH